MSACDEDILAYARQQGWANTCEELTPRKYRQAATAIRPMRKKIVDGATAIESRVATSPIFGWRRMPDEVVEENKAVCEACPKGKFTRLVGGEPVCNICQCSDKWLKAKWSDTKQKCPYGYWDNPKRLVQLRVVRHEQPTP